MSTPSRTLLRLRAVHPDDQQEGEAPTAATPPPRHRWRPPAWFWVVLAGLIVAGGVFHLGRSTDASQQSADESLGQAQVLAPTVLQACDELNATARAARADCTVAEQVAQQPAPTTIAPGLDRAEVLALIQQQLETLQLPPGQLPTAEQVTAAAQVVLTSNPGLFRGPAGPAGEGPTDEQIRTAAESAVTAYFAANPVPAGPPGGRGDPGEPGQNGAPGRGIVGTQTDGCYVVITFDQEPLQERVGPFCEEPPPSSDPDPTPDPDPGSDPGQGSGDEPGGLLGG